MSLNADTQQDQPSHGQDTAEAAPACQFCETSPLHSYARLPVLDNYTAFHKDCDQCSKAKSSKEAYDPLCDFCQHLRLGHLLYCKPGLWTVSFGTWDDIKSVENCALHSLLKQYTEFQLKTHQYRFDDIRLMKELHFGTKKQGGLPLVAFLDGKLKSYITTFEMWFAREHVPSHVHVPESIDWAQLRSEVASCFRSHPSFSTGTRRGIQTPSTIRLIDVEKRQLIQSNTITCRYVTLSYVWGFSPDRNKLMTTSSTVQEYEKEGGLPAQFMPATVEDAIQICLGMGERYLWVDRLCIVQDDKESKREQISGMQDIYSNATYTIVALSGDNMDVCLPGVSKERPFLTGQCRFSNLHIQSCLPSLIESVQDSAWATRAWTYQEHLLSKRQLFIAPGQSFWVCAAGVTSEQDILNGNGPQFASYAERSLAQGSAHQRPGDPFTSFSEVCSTYNARRLSYASDVYNAFSGIAAEIYGVSDYSQNFCCGLPIRDIDAALLWHSQRGYRHGTRSCSETHIPTWSWASISGTIGFLSISGSLVRWAINTDQDSKKVRDVSDSILAGLPLSSCITTNWKHVPSGDGTDSSDNSYMKYLPDSPCLNLALAVAEGCFPGGSPTMEPIGRLQHMTFGTYTEITMAKWPSYVEFWYDAFRSLSASQVPAVKPQTGQTLLSTQGQTSFVRTSKHPSHVGCYFYVEWEIQDLSGKSIGVVFDPVKLNEPSGVQQLDGQLLKIMAISVGPVDKMLSCCFPEVPFPFSEISDNAYKDLNISYEDCDGTVLRPAPVVNVLLLGKKGDLSYRIAIGIVYLKRWAELERKFETVTLC
ncbi:HET-domain-containing protein [Plenodomus tracheiphilus IPT5]|uniref:HET-domain-containing protein n=1 Tax=Plenodomus tracheiphilus IPT5 TaxID=1408161 RepID=A0A6A7BKT2_9PLEO|nr:HET-domain-containing protein [Plenodomus tracheiphilus IPT5]